MIAWLGVRGLPIPPFTLPGLRANHLRYPTPRYCTRRERQARLKPEGRVGSTHPAFGRFTASSGTWRFGDATKQALLVFLRGIPLPDPFDGVRQELCLGIADAVAGAAAEQVLMLVALLLQHLGHPVVGL